MTYIGLAFIVIPGVIAWLWGSTRKLPEWEQGLIYKQIFESDNEGMKGRE